VPSLCKKARVAEVLLSGVLRLSYAQLFANLLIGWPK
jgi:hypothetical protein